MFVFAYVIGQTALGDAYKLGNETPNIVYDLLLGGVLSATLVPLFTSFLREATATTQPPRTTRATNVVITTAATLMIALTVVAVVAAPLDLPASTASPCRPRSMPTCSASVGTTLTRIFLIQILFYGLTGVANAYLQSRRRFFAAAWSPILPNLVIIATLLLAPGAGEHANGSCRTCWTTAACGGRSVSARRSASPRWRWSSCRRCSWPGCGSGPAWDWKHPAVRKLLVLSGWTIGFVAANQVAVVVVRNLATREGEGIAVRVRRRLHVVRAPARPAWRCRSPRRSSPSWRGRCSSSDRAEFVDRSVARARG